MKIITKKRAILISKNLSKRLFYILEENGKNLPIAKKLKIEKSIFDSFGFRKG